VVEPVDAEGLRLVILFPYTSNMEHTKISRAAIREGLNTIPIEQVLNVSSRALTHKQKQFCKEVAMGATSAEAYRRSYNTKANPKIVGSEASKLKSKPSITQEIQAYQLAMESEKQRTPAALRALAIQSLVQVMIDPEAKDATKVQAAKAIGAITEVALFTERRETKVITSSENSKAVLMEQLRDLMKANATDAHVIEAEASTLLEELAAVTHPSPTPLTGEQESQDLLHTIPLERSDSQLDTPPPRDLPQRSPTHPFREDPPVGS
jgi:hypothetical protein